MFRALFVVLLLFALVYGLIYFYEGGELPIVGGTLGDAKTTASVKAAFALHRDLSRRPISVRTRDGVVALTGEVASEAEKREAETLVRSVDEVRGVDNLIAVTPDLKSEAETPERTLGQKLDDTAIATKVKGAFALHRDLKDLEISVEVKGGTVFLEGQVETPSQAELARERALTVEGVREVETLFQTTAAEESTEQVAARTDAALAGNENLRNYDLRAVVHNGAIILEGEVSTGAERELAELLAERVTGGRKLRNEIRLKRR